MTTEAGERPSRTPSMLWRLVTWLRRGGWLIVAAALPLAAILSTTIHVPPHYDALSGPAAPTDALPPELATRLSSVVAASSPRFLGTDQDTAYYVAEPTGDESGICFIAAPLNDLSMSQTGCSSPGANASIQYADVTLSDHAPGDDWVEIAEDVWRDTTWKASTTTPD